MENFQSNLAYPSYSGVFGKSSQTDENIMQSAGNSNLSGSGVIVSSESPIISFHSTYQPSDLHRVPPIDSSSVRYSDKNIGASTDLCRVAGLDMTNKVTSVNMILNQQTNCLASMTKSYNVSKPTSKQSNVSSLSKSYQSGDIQLQNYSKSDINMSKTESSNQTSFGPQTLQTSYVPCEKSYIPCEENSITNCVYRCGGCEERFYTICKLHAHIKTHNENGSYYFSESAKTAYPKFVTYCKETQTNNKYLTNYSYLVTEDLNEISDDTAQDSNTSTVDLIKQMGNNTNSAIENEPDIKMEEEDHCKSEINNSGSDTDDYKPEESLLFDQEKRQKIPKRKRKEVNKVNAKGSRKLKKLKMTIRLKQEGRKENRVSFIKKDRKPKKCRDINVKRQKVDEKIICKMCGEEFAKRLFLRHHIKAKHSDVEYLCQLCGEQYTADEELIEHRKTVHNRGYHRCELCDKVLSTKGMLEGHYLVHKGIKPFACDICVPKKEFTRKCQLKAHMDTHSTEKTLQCEFCGKPFNARYLMLSHVKHCGGIKPHKCEYCEMSFVSNHCLQRHRRTHTGEKPFVCEVCAFASSNASCLARHMRTHTGEKPFTCQFCQQTFAARGALKKHVRIHTQEKPYKCRFCTKAFTQNWNLKTHERQHTGETPYKCHVCGVGYKQNVLLKTHMRTHFGQTSEGSESQNFAVNQTVSQSLTENQPSLNCQSVQSQSRVQTTFKSENLKSEFLESQPVNNQSHLTELHSQPLVQNILLSSYLHSGYNMN